MSIFGKQVKGKTNWIPDYHMWGGMLFIHWLRRSVMIPIPEPTIKRLQDMGFDPLDGGPRVQPIKELTCK